MEMIKVNPEVVRRLREERAWSQEHLAAATGLSLRTIQRVASDGNASAETRMSLATAFGIVMLRASTGIEPLASATRTALEAPLGDVISALLGASAR